MKYLSLSTVFAFLAIFFGIQANRAANGDGLILCIAIATLDLMIAVYFIGQYEDSKRSKSAGLTLEPREDLPTEDGVYLTKFTDEFGTFYYPDTTVFRDGQWLKATKKKITHWAGPIETINITK